MKIRRQNVYLLDSVLLRFLMNKIPSLVVRTDTGRKHGGPSTLAKIVSISCLFIVLFLFLIYCFFDT